MVVVVVAVGVAVVVAVGVVVGVVVVVGVGVAVGVAVGVVVVSSHGPIDALRLNVANALWKDSPSAETRYKADAALDVLVKLAEAGLNECVERHQVVCDCSLCSVVDALSPHLETEGS